MTSSSLRSIRRVPAVMLILGGLLALMLLGLPSAASAQVGPPVSACGPGQKPSVDKCFPPAPCQAGQDPVRDECMPVNPMWPDPVASSRQCVDFYTYGPSTTCEDVRSHYTYAGVAPPGVPTPGRVSQTWLYSCVVFRDHRRRDLCAYAPVEG